MSRSACILATILLLGCAGTSPESAVSELSTGTYAGDLPCADCPGQRLVVTLFPDGTFRLRRTYRAAAGGRDESFYDLGRAHLTTGRLTLRGGAASGHEFEVVARDRLRLLDDEGLRIDSSHPYELARQPALDRLEGPLRLRGMYTYLADAASLEECLTGVRYPVLLVRDHVALERAYLAQRGEPGAPVLASLDGRFELREPEPGLAPREHVIVERFERLWPGETCSGEAPARSDLLEIYWRAIEIDGAPVSLAAGQREPHFVLSAEGNRVQGFAGCNSMGGGFARSADNLRFSALFSTRMACAPPVAQLETRFLRALEATASYRVAGDVLELRDGFDAVRMRLEATRVR